MVAIISWLLASLGVVILCLSYCHAQLPDIRLEGRSYLLSAELIVDYPWKSSYFYEVQELHSSWQNRSRISYRTLAKSNPNENTASKPDAGFLYADGNQVLLVDEDGKKCTTTSDGFADTLFDLNMLKSYKEQPSVIGPSRFLLYAQSNREHIADQTIARRTRNKPSMIKYDFEIGSDENELLSLYYYKDLNMNLPNGLPAELTAIIKGVDDYIVNYKFKRIEFLANEPVFSSAGIHLGAAEGIEQPGLSVDKLAMPPAIGCAQMLKNSLDIRALRSSDHRFSFRGQVIKEKAPYILDMFVSYEPSLSSLRVDRRTSSRLTTTLSNFQMGFTYNLLNRLADSDIVFDHVLKVRENDKLDDQQSCVVTRNAPPNTKAQSIPALGQMLFGTTELKDLGLARVRGIEARVLEAYNCSWPIWIQQPIMYHTTKDWINISNGVEYRPTSGQFGGFLLNIVVYMSRAPADSSPLASPLDSKPLLFEIYKLNPVTSVVIEKIVVPIFQFTWHLSNDSPDGGAREQYFSLGDACTPQNGDTHYGRVDLLLRHEPPSLSTSTAQQAQWTAGWLKQTIPRNVAIMRATQERLGLSANMIYDIESRVWVKPIANRGRVVSIPASLRVATHMRWLVQLVYIARGSIKADARKRFRFFYATSFQVCYFIAAHQKIDTIFAYDESLNKCFLFLGTVFGTTKMTIQNSIDVGDRGSLEIYRLRHARELNVEDEITALKRVHERLSHMESLRLMDPRNESRQVDLRVQSMQVIELDQKDPYQVDEMQLSDTNKYQGLGLVVGDSQNRVVQAERLRTGGSTSALSEAAARKLDNLLSDMTFGQCQGECMADFECQSFSVCLREGQLQCVTSTVSFKPPMMALQLLQIQNKRTKIDEQFTVSVEREASTEAANETIHLRRHPTCELHNKFHIDLYGSAQQVRANLRRRRLHPVSGREHCARKCFHSMLGTLKADVEMAYEATLRALYESEVSPKVVQEIFKNYKLSHLEMCTSFLYLDAENYEQLDSIYKPRLESHILDHNEEEITNGYCILGEMMSEAEESQLNGANALVAEDPNRRLELRVEWFQFDFKHLYNKQFGMSLVESPLSLRETFAYKQITKRLGREETRETYDIMRAVVERGDNIGYTLVAGAAQCASTCFLQFVPMWPGCKSFDLIEVALNGSKETHCFFNSITAREALEAGRFDLLRNHADEQARAPKEFVHRVTHYEPKNNFILRSLTLANKLEINMDSIDVDHLDDPEYDESTFGLKLGHFGLFCTILVALCAGTSAGIYVSTSLIRRLQGPREDAENLVESRKPVLEFKNLVNFEGLIPNGEESAHYNESED